MSSENGATSKVINIFSSPPMNDGKVYIGNGDVLHIQCNTTNSSFLANMEFHFNTKTKNNKYSISEGETKINISLNMTGTKFYCKSKFYSIEASKVILLFVVDLPEFKETEDVTNTTEGESVQLHRVFVSHGNHNLSWFKDDQMLNQTERIHVSKYEERNSTDINYFSVVNITSAITSNEGSYTCRVCNLAGCKDEVSHLYVYQDTKQNSKSVPSTQLMPLIYTAVVALVIAIVLTITGLVVYRRRNEKKAIGNEVIVFENELYVSADEELK